MEHKKILKVVQGNWRHEASLSDNLHKLAGNPQAWNKSTFGNIFERKKRTLQRLDGVQKSLSSSITPGLIKLEL